MGELIRTEGSDKRKTCLLQNQRTLTTPRDLEDVQLHSSLNTMLKWSQEDANYYYYFEIGCLSLAYAGLEFTKQLNLTINSGFSCFPCLSLGTEACDTMPILCFIRNLQTCSCPLCLRRPVPGHPILPGRQQNLQMFKYLIQNGTIMVHNLLSVNLTSSLGYLQCQRKYIFLHMKGKLHMPPNSKGRTQERMKGCA